MEIRVQIAYKDDAGTEFYGESSAKGLIDDGEPLVAIRGCVCGAASALGFTEKGIYEAFGMKD